MSNILITGVAGLLGSRMAQWIIENKPDYRVIGIDDLSGGLEGNIPEEVQFFHINCNNDLTGIFKTYRPEYVYHFAAYAAEGLSPFIRRFNYRNNLEVTANIVNNCIKYDVKRLVFTSSMAVYGNGKPPFDESADCNPIDPYGIAKYACEMDIRVAGEQHGLDWCIIRPHNVYGRNQNIWDKYRNVLGIWMYQSLTNQPMTIFGDGSQVRAFSYIDDCLLPLWHAATRKVASKQIINLGGTEGRTIMSAARSMQKITDNSVIFLEKRHEAGIAYPTWQKSVDILDFKDTTPFEDGLLKMWEWAKEQPVRKRKEWNSFELDKGIYSYWKIK